MISVSEATAVIQAHAFPFPTKSVNLADAIGRVLAQPVQADRDLPPFNRATMDGIAIATSSFNQGQREYSIAHTQAAGEPATTLADPSHAVEIMTGAIVPDGCDAVIRYEDISIDSGKARINLTFVDTGQNIHRRGVDAQAGESLLEPGLMISAAEVALLASVGMSSVEVYQCPTVAIISTGNELVDIDSKPLPHQIRRSNSHALQAALHQLGCPTTLYHFDDDERLLHRGLSNILQQHQLVILSGGVSKGKFDYIPSALKALGIQQKFHEVSQRPGKPLWFGASDQQVVFALPGNPMSTFMCFHRYIKPWLYRCMASALPSSLAILAKDFSFKPALTHFLQVKVVNEAGRLMAYPDAGGGSGDFVNLKEVTGFVELPMEKNVFTAGEAYPYFSFR